MMSRFNIEIQCFTHSNTVRSGIIANVIHRNVGVLHRIPKKRYSTLEKWVQNDLQFHTI